MKLVYLLKQGNNKREDYQYCQYGLGKLFDFRFKYTWRSVLYKPSPKGRSISRKSR